MIAGIARADLDVDSGRQRVEALQRVDCLRRWLIDVDQPLVGADLECSRESLSLNGERITQ